MFEYKFYFADYWIQWLKAQGFFNFTLDYVIESTLLILIQILMKIFFSRSF